MAKIYIDIGHGGVDETGVDTGTSGYYNNELYKENEVNLNIGLVVKKTLEELGHKVITQRTENKNFGSLVGHYGRADSNLINSASYCKSTDCDCMISIHNNAYSNTNARGYVLIYKAGSEATEEVITKSKELCDCINEKISNVLPKNDVRKVLGNSGKDYYGILRLHNKIGVLIECGFMTNVNDMKALVENYEEIGKSIALGINKYVNGEDEKTPTEIIEELEEEVASLQSELEKSQKQIENLQKENNIVVTKNEVLQEKLESALKFDIDKDGQTTDADAVYLIKHLLEPENYPL